MEEDNIFKPKYYFEELHEIFNGIKYVWEAIPRISELLKGKGLLVGKGTIIEEGAVIKSPAIIGDNCEVRSGTYIRGNVIIGNNCVIRSELKNCLVMDNSNAAHLSYLGDSIVGRNCNLGAGTILANLRLKEDSVRLKVNNKVYDTKLSKFGAIIGDNTKTGCHVLTNPGTLIGKNVFIYSHASLNGFYESSTIIKHRQNLEIVKKN